MTLVFGMKKAQQMGYVLCCASCCFLEHLCAAKQMCFHTSYIRPSGNVTMTGPSKRHSRCGVAHPVQMGKDLKALSDRNLRDPLPSQTGRSVRPVCSRLGNPTWKLRGLSETCLTQLTLRVAGKHSLRKARQSTLYLISC